MPPISRTATAPPAFWRPSEPRFPWLRHVFADGGYAGANCETPSTGIGDWTLEIIKRSDTAKGFEVLPRRWVVERTFAWLGRCRRLAKDWEKSIASAEAWILVAHIRLVTRRLARYCYVQWSFESGSKVERCSTSLVSALSGARP